MLQKSFGRRSARLIRSRRYRGQEDSKIYPHQKEHCATDRPHRLLQHYLTYPDDLGEYRIEAGLPAFPASQRALLLFTSGSAGRPPPSAKSWGALVRSADAAGNRLGVRSIANATVIGTVPHQHSYGLPSSVDAIMESRSSIEDPNALRHGASAAAAPPRPAAISPARSATARLIVAAMAAALPRYPGSAIAAWWGAPTRPPARCSISQCASS
jgi:hypothetical protein